MREDWLVRSEHDYDRQETVLVCIHRRIRIPCIRVVIPDFMNEKEAEAMIGKLMDERELEWTKGLLVGHERMGYW